MKAKAKTQGHMKFTVVPSPSRKYGYSIKVTIAVTWVKGPGNTFGWYRRKRDAQQRCNELNQGTTAEQCKSE
jgi:hypothetical protein